MRAAYSFEMAALATALTASRLFSQLPAPTAVDDLRPPAAPAFVLLGIEPASVTRPSSARALAAWAFTRAGQEGVIPQNLAVEIAPYWLVSRPSFTFEEYFSGSYVKAKDIGRIIGTTIMRSFALSTASAPRLVQSDSAGSSLAIGARTLVWPGRAPGGLMEQKKRLEVLLGECATHENSGPCFERTLLLRDSIRAGLREPVGFALQVSGGVSFESPNDSLRDARWRRVGVWISPTYRTDGRIDWIFVGRYQRDRGDSLVSDESNLFDAGMRLTWHPSTAFALSAEGLHRRIADDVVARIRCRQKKIGFVNLDPTDAREPIPGERNARGV